MSRNKPTQQERIVRPNRKLRPTTVCLVAGKTPSPPPLRVVRLPLAGALGGEITTPRRPSLPVRTRSTRSYLQLYDLRLESIGDILVEPVRTMVLAHLAGKIESAPSLQLYDLTMDPQPHLELRVRAIYAVDEGVTPSWSLDHIRAAVGAIVEAANRDLEGTGFRLVFFPRHDVEIRNDTSLRRDFVLSDELIALFNSGDVDEEKGIAILDEASKAVANHRNQVANERPNTMLWLFSRGCRFDVVKDASGNFQRWDYVDDREASFSWGDIDFVALHEGFLSSIEGGRQDASRAVHETGHYLGLGHTHRDPCHDFEYMTGKVPDRLSPDLLDDPAPDRLAAWKQAVAKWLDEELADGSSPEQAHDKYDADRDGGVKDSPADPGAGIMALANEAAGHGYDEFGPIDSITLDVPNVTGPVTFKPLRDNVMGYYLRETPEAMRFTGGQVDVMRNFLINGGRRLLVAAQLGDTATPDLRVCAVWSPKTENQRLTWGWTRDDHLAEHERNRQAGMVMVHQQAYTYKGMVLYDAIWNPGNYHQKILGGWLAQDVYADLPAKAAQGLVPVVVQGYQHLDQGTRYNVIYEPGSGDAKVFLGITQDELDKEYESWKTQGYRMTCLSPHLNSWGGVRYSTVLRPTGKPQSWVAGWTLEDIAEEYGRQWNNNFRLHHISLVRTTYGHRWSAVFEPDNQNQLVYWAHVRERITEVYDEMWGIDFKVRALWVVPA
jgi:hypothetical protein